MATIIGCNGQIYENTDPCWDDLQRASLFAWYLGLIPAGDLDDHRSPDETFHLAPTPDKPRAGMSRPWLGGVGGLSLADMSPREHGLPELHLTDVGDLPELRVSMLDPGYLSLPKLGELHAYGPVAPYHLEILCEK